MIYRETYLVPTIKSPCFVALEMTKMKLSLSSLLAQTNNLIYSSMSL